jgi:hypothetical protein
MTTSDGAEKIINLHLYQPALWMEADRRDNALHDVLTEPLIVPHDGMLKVPENE